MQLMSRSRLARIVQTGRFLIRTIRDSRPNDSYEADPGRFAIRIGRTSGETTLTDIPRARSILETNMPNAEIGRILRIDGGA